MELFEFIFQGRLTSASMAFETEISNLQPITTRYPWIEVFIRAA